MGPASDSYIIQAMRFATKALRVGQEPDATFRAVVPPLYQSTTFAWASLDDIPKIDYTRCQNPNRQMLEEVIASLEGGAGCTLTSSGMAAIAACFSLLKQGDHLLMATDIYGGTFRMVEQYLPQQGISHSVFDAHRPETIAAAVTPASRMLIFETPANPTLRVCDIAAVVAEAKRHGLIVVFDNTFASPALQNPIALGVDLVVHSTTKYISGHSDVLGGCVVSANDELAHTIYEWNKAYGATPSRGHAVAIRLLAFAARATDAERANGAALRECPAGGRGAAGAPGGAQAAGAPGGAQCVVSGVAVAPGPRGGKAADERRLWRDAGGGVPR